MHSCLVDKRTQRVTPTAAEQQQQQLRGRLGPPLLISSLSFERAWQGSFLCMLLLHHGGGCCCPERPSLVLTPQAPQTACDCLLSSSSSSPPPPISFSASASKLVMHTFPPSSPHTHVIPPAPPAGLALLSPSFLPSSSCCSLSADDHVPARAALRALVVAVEHLVLRLARQQRRLVAATQAREPLCVGQASRQAGSRSELCLRAALRGREGQLGEGLWWWSGSISVDKVRLHGDAVG